MSLDRLIVGNYRAFAGRRVLDLRPITLLYGWNNAGKSALLRLIAMLGNSILETAPGPIDTAGVLDHGGGFSSLLSKHTDLAEVPDALQLGLGWSDGLEGEYEVRIDRTGLQYIGRVTQRSAGAEAIEFVARGVGMYSRIIERQPDAPRPIEFAGLIPHEASLQLLSERLSALRQRIQWLRAVRARPPRRFEPGGARPRVLKPDGSDAIQVLALDTVVRAAVGRWFQRVTTREFEVREEGSERRLLLRPPARAMDIDLVDTGEGMVQCLPVLVAAAMTQLPRGPRILAVEEPESHLHPRAQAELAQYLCALAAGDDPPTLVMETHSYAMLLGVQLAIAKGDVPAERVVLHWIDGARTDTESAVETITFDRFGRPSRDGVMPIFATESELANELAAAQHGAW